MRPTTYGSSLWRWGLALLSSSAVLLFAHAFVPIEEFIHRGDDAFYYFKVAIDHPSNGFWSFDGVHPTNGVQPLWAMILTTLAYPLRWLGLSDPAAARAYVALTAAFHLAAGLLLYRLLARTVSVGTGLAAAGGILFSMAFTWSHVWGMENALYTTVLIGTVSFYHFRFIDDDGAKNALILGLLLGLTALSRLNAGMLVPFMGVAYLVSGPREELGRRIRVGAIVSGGVALLIVPYVSWNLYTTGHILPVSGSVKSVQTAMWLAEREVESRFSVDFLRALFWGWHRSIEWFISSRVIDGLWVIGARVPLQETGTTGEALIFMIKLLAAVLAAIVALPLLVGRRSAWFRFLGKRFRRLGRFWYLGAFAVVNSALSVVLYPSEVYSIIRWWLAECELMVVVMTATLLVAALSFVGRRWLTPQRRVRVAVVAVATLAIYHTAETIHTYWDGEKQDFGWNQSWNDHIYMASQWINENLPEDAVVGSWNAGILGFYTEQTVVNLDGLINNHDLLPFIESRTVADYIRREGIRYLSDYGPELAREGVLEELAVREIYTTWTDWGNAYRIYEVLH